MYVCLFIFNLVFLQGGQQCWILWAFLAVCLCRLCYSSILYLCLLIGQIKMLACSMNILTFTHQQIKAGANNKCFDVRLQRALDSGRRLWRLARHSDYGYEHWRLPSWMFRPQQLYRYRLGRQTAAWKAVLAGRSLVWSRRFQRGNTASQPQQNMRSAVTLQLVEYCVVTRRVDPYVISIIFVHSIC